MILRWMTFWLRHLHDVFVIRMHIRNINVWTACCWFRGRTSALLFVMYVSDTSLICWRSPRLEHAGNAPRRTGNQGSREGDARPVVGNLLPLALALG